MPYFEPSRPRPDSFTPPNGATSVEMRPVLMRPSPIREIRHTPHPSDVAAVEVRGEAELGVVGECNRLVVGGEAEERRDRTECLFAGDKHLLRDPGEHDSKNRPPSAGRWRPIITAAPRPTASAMCSSTFATAFVDEWALRRTSLEAIGRLQLLNCGKPRGFLTDGTDRQWRAYVWWSPSVTGPRTRGRGRFQRRARGRRRSSRRGSVSTLL